MTATTPRRYWVVLRMSKWSSWEVEQRGPQIIALPRMTLDHSPLPGVGFLPAFDSFEAATEYADDGDVIHEFQERAS